MFSLPHLYIFCYNLYIDIATVSVGFLLIDLSQCLNFFLNVLGTLHLVICVFFNKCVDRNELETGNALFIRNKRQSCKHHRSIGKQAILQERQMQVHNRVTVFMVEHKIYIKFQKIFVSILLIQTVLFLGNSRGFFCTIDVYLKETYKP